MAEECAAADSAFAAVAMGKNLNGAWLNALVGTAIISLFGNVGIVIYMFIDSGSSSSKSTNGNNNSAALNTMVAFAVGGLLGDVFLHLLPHASSHHDHHNHHQHDNTSGLFVLLGIFSFFVFEKLVRAYHHKGGGGHHSHSHSHAKTDELTSTTIRPGAWLNLFADVQHNFVDGMAIASAFQVSNKVGTSTMLGVLLHEIPHEMGDFAVLLNQGFSKRQALLCQFVSSAGAFAGCLFGLWMGSSSGGTSNNTKMLSFTAGGFVYVALVDVLPELLQSNSTSSLWQTARELAAIALGVYIMVLVGDME